MTTPRTVELVVNGEHRAADAEPRMLLSDFLREKLGLTGTHVGCEHGVCGACTVLVNGEAARSCLMLAVQAAGTEVRSPSRGSAGSTTCNPLQEAFWEKHGLQCGFCTPGMLMTAVELLESTPNAGMDEIREAMSSNLCRCTGYQTIVDAVQAAAERMQGEGQ